MALPGFGDRQPSTQIVERAPDRGSGPAGIAGGVGDTGGEATEPEVVEVADMGVGEPASVLVVHDPSTKTEATA